MAKRYLNLDLAAWRSLRRRFPGSRVGWRDRLAYRGIGSSLSLLPRPQTGASMPPIVLVGHWRSGTTLLHELITAGKDFCWPSTEACMNPQRFLSGLEQKSDKISRRPMDGMTISAASPQEDEFALFCLGAPSPYEALLIPGAMKDAAARSEVDKLAPEERRQWEAAFLTFLGAVQKRHSDRTVVLKSPPHAFRIAAIRRLVPGARFVAITRDPEAVFASTRRLWQDMWDLYAVAPKPGAKARDKAILQNMLAVHRALKGGMAALPPGGGIAVTYEELVSDPQNLLRRIGEVLSLESLVHPGAGISARIAAMRDYRRQPIALADADKAALRADCAELF